MVTKTYIVPSLQALDVAYITSATADEAERCAKLAIIELCGWIEESMDALILRCGRRNLKVAKNLAYCQTEIIEKTWGFDYQRNFRFMLIRLVGLIKVEQLEIQVDQAKHAAFQSKLASLKVIRNSVAHTHLKGVTRALNAPSVTLRDFLPVYDGLMDFDQTMRKQGL